LGLRVSRNRAFAFAIGSLGGVMVGFWFARQPRVAAVFDPM
jgi:NitT/TauT family transport system permease protein